MSRANYDYLEGQEDIAGSYQRDGQPAPLYQYAANSATALSASTSDLTRFVLAQLDETGPLSASTLASMREPHGHEMSMAIFGLGVMLYHPNGEGDFVFGHDGANDPSINASVRINPGNGNAIVALSTGPAYLASRLAYQWGLWDSGYPDFIQSNLALDSARIPLLVGLVCIALISLLIALRRRR